MAVRIQLNMEFNDEENKMLWDRYKKFVTKHKGTNVPTFRQWAKHELLSTK